MAQKQGQYEGAIDSIFNFIFASNKQNSPQRPKKPIPGVSGNEMADALGEIVANPAMYVSEQALEVVNEPLDQIGVTIAEVQLTGDKKYKVGVSAKNIGQFFDNPDGFVDAALARADAGAKAARQVNFMRGLGGIVDLGIGAVQAKSQGMSTISSLEMGTILGAESMGLDSRNYKAEELATRASALGAAKAGGLNYDQANKVAQSFNSVMESSRAWLVNKDVTKLEHGDRVRLKQIMDKKLAGYGISSGQVNFDDLFNKYSDRAERYKNKEGYNWNVGQLDRGLSKNYSKNLDFRKEEDWIESKNPGDKIRALKYEEITEALSFFEGVPDSDPKKKELLKQREQIRIWQLANGKNARWSRYFGEASLNFQHLNALVLQGGAIPGLISGDIFDPRKNNMTPSKERKFFSEVKGRNGKKEKIEHKINVPRDDFRLRGYTKLNSLYYFTPGSIGKTFFYNGEGFAYLGHLKEQKIKDLITGSDSLYEYARINASNPFFAALLKDIDLKNQKEVLGALAGNYEKLIEVLNSDRASITDTQLLAVLGELEKRLKKYKGSSSMKIANSIKKNIADRLDAMKKRFTESLGNMMIRVLGKNLGGRLKELLITGQLTLKRVARGLAKKAVHAIAQALGVVFSGALANALIYAVTEVIYFVAEKLLRPAIKLLALFLWALVFFIIFAMLGTFSFLNALNPFSSVSKKFDTAGNTAPIFCEQCGGSPISGSETSGDSDPSDGSPNVVVEAPPDAGPISPPPEMANVTCPLGSTFLDCSQRPYGGYSHSGVNAIDIKGPPPSYWYAPSDGVITRSIWSYENSRIPGQLCGGIVHFYSPEHDVTYVLVHVVPYVQNNQEITAGTPLGKMALESDGNIHFRSDSGTCATGAHFHLEVRGTDVYADRYYRDFLNCDLGACPGTTIPEKPQSASCEGYKTFSPNEFKDLGDRVLGIGSSKPYITNNSQADAIIRSIAVSRGYKPRNDAGSFNSSASTGFNNMIAAAQKDGINISIAYDYRTVDRQRTLFMTDLNLNKNEHCVQSNYANIINRSCDDNIDQILRTRSIPGYSKHHTGYVVDLSCNGGSITAFGSSACYKWISETNYCNAKESGIIPSYPPGATNQGPDPEAWEYIWVGVNNLK